MDHFLVIAFKLHSTLTLLISVGWLLEFNRHMADVAQTEAWNTNCYWGDPFSLQKIVRVNAIQLHLSNQLLDPNLGWLLRGSFWGGGEWVKSPPSPLLPVQNLLELCQNLEVWHVSTHTYVVSENVTFNTKALLFLLMSAFFANNKRFWLK